MSIIKKDRYIKGTHNAVSDFSGQKYKRKDMRFTWDRKLVGADEWEPKQPQIMIRGRDERIAVSNGTRTQKADLPLDVPAFIAGS